MHTSLPRIALLAGMLFLAALACESFSLPKDQESGLRTVSVSPRQGTGPVTARIHYIMSAGDIDFSISCSYPAADGTIVASALDLDSREENAYLTIPVTKAGEYSITCSDNRGSSASDLFTITEPAQSEEPTSSEPADSEESKRPKPGDFSKAGLWMLFDEGTSNPVGVPVPRQCLPGVNYTHVGGTSHLDVAADGTLTGECALSYYDNVQRLSGTLTGSWNGETGEIIFQLETVTVYDAVTSNGSGTTTNKTSFSGTGFFLEGLTATGSADWSTHCESTNTQVAVCQTGFEGVLDATGTVPWQMNFEP